MLRDWRGLASLHKFFRVAYPTPLMATNCCLLPDAIGMGTPKILSRQAILGLVLSSWPPVFKIFWCSTDYWESNQSRTWMTILGSTLELSFAASNGNINKNVYNLHHRTIFVIKRQKTKYFEHIITCLILSASSSV